MRTASWFIDSCAFAVSSCSRRKKGARLGFLYRGSNPIHEDRPPHDLITSQIPHLCTLPLGIRFQYMTLRWEWEWSSCKRSVHSSQIFLSRVQETVTNNTRYCGIRPYPIYHQLFYLKISRKEGSVKMGICQRTSE